MPDEARLERVGNGLVPTSDGWYVLNAREAAWATRETFGARCSFAGDGANLRGHDVDFEPWAFPQVGINLMVVPPGCRSTLYHAEGQQEDFLVLRGSCLAIVEEQERRMHEWDLLHCPPGTRHALVNDGDEPLVVLMIGARNQGGGIVYPVSELAQRHGAGVETETDDPREAYAAHDHWRNLPGPPNPAGL
jgi:uncharacterized cupin superfamily protein